MRAEHCQSQLNQDSAKQRGLIIQSNQAELALKKGHHAIQQIKVSHCGYNLVYLRSEMSQSFSTTILLRYQFKAFKLASEGCSLKCCKMFVAPFTYKTKFRVAKQAFL